MNPNITEKQFAKTFEIECKLGGWRYYHTFLSRFSVAGFPDYCLVKGNRLVFVELKVGKNQPTPEQYEWLDLLSMTPNTEVYLFYPEDEIEVTEVLSGKLIAMRKVEDYL